MKAMTRAVLGLMLFCVLGAVEAAAEPPDRMCSAGKWGHVECIRDAHFAFDTCQALDRFAARHGLDSGFFARLIWQESRFDPNALSHANARGIAQFIPSTAKLRGLENPYNPADALAHSAQYLAELKDRFGNEGMAAVAYNGGERRAEGFLEGKGLAQETWDYVPIITGVGATTWRDNPPENHDFRLSKEEAFLPACLELAKNRKLSPVRPPPGANKPWGVQVTWGPSRDAAQQAFARLQDACPASAEIDAPQYVNIPHRMRNRPPYIAVRFGHDTRSSADRLCRNLRRSGCVCAVFKNSS